MNTKAKGIRVEGTDGSDGKYRMTVETRYRLLAVTRSHLAKAHLYQLFYALVGLVTFGLSLVGLLGSASSMTVVLILLHIVYIGMVVVGKNAAKNNSLGGLRAYGIFLLITAAVLLGAGVVMPFVSLGATLGTIVSTVVSIVGIALSLYGAQQANILHGAVEKKD